MKIPRYFVLFAVLVLLLAIAAGCSTSQQKTPAATQAPLATPPTQVIVTSTAVTRTVSSPGLDTTVNVKSSGLSCINVGDYLGVTYLYPDQKFKLEASSPGANTITANILFVDENDQLKLREITPRRDAIKNIWVYDGIVPLAQFNDITIPVEKTFTIKRQSKYYICADDRQESLINENMYRVPVKLTRL